MQKFPRRWNRITCVNYLQRKVILNALTYYELNTSIITNEQYDELKSQLINLQSQININETQYGYIMNSLDSMSSKSICEGLALEDRDRLMCIAMLVVKKHQKSTSHNIKKGALF